LATMPAIADVALFCQDAVEQNETHDAADVQENNPENESGNEYCEDQSSEERGIESSEVRDLVYAAGVVRAVKVWDIEIASARAEFAGEQADEGETHPLAEAKGLQKLPLGMFEGGRDRVNGGKWQGSPQAYRRPSRKVLRMQGMEQIKSQAL